MTSGRPPFAIDRTWWLALITLAAVLVVFLGWRRVLGANMNKN